MRRPALNLALAGMLAAAAAVADPVPIDSGAGVPVLSLDTVLARVERHPELRKWGLRAEARAAAARGAGAWMAPELGVGGAELPYPGMAGGMAPGDPSLMLSARQMIPGPGKTGSRRSYRLSLAGADRAEGRFALARLAADARTQYARLAIAGRRLAVVREAEAVMALMLEVAEIRFRRRQADLSAVLEARARKEELSAMGAAEAAMGRQAESALARLMGMPGHPPFRADTALRLRPPEGAAAPGADRRGDLERMDAEIRSMELGLASMRREGRPDFGLQFDHMDMLGMGRRFSVMAMMTLPSAPWSSGMARAEAAAMEKDIAAMRADREAMSLMAGRMAEEMRLMLASEAEQHARYDGEIAPARRKSLDAALASYQEGAGDLFRVLDAWDRWLMSRMRALDHLEKALVLEAEYDREAGRR